MVVARILEEAVKLQMVVAVRAWIVEMTAQVEVGRKLEVEVISWVGVGEKIGFGIEFIDKEDGTSKALSDFL